MIANCIDFERLEAQAEHLKLAFQTSSPFRHLLIDDFCHTAEAERLAQGFPKSTDEWIDASGRNTRKKRTSPVPKESLAAQFFEEAQSSRFLDWLSFVTEIDEFKIDPAYFGAGFHQTAPGGYLNVHIDFNRLKNGLDRRLNLLVYMNPEWHDDWGGEIELWDVPNDKKVFSALPKLNRAIIFETNEVSYHGQPNPVASPDGTFRNSFSVYYYTEGRPDEEVAPDHSTIYVNVEGQKGRSKNALNMLEQIVTISPIRRRLRDRKKK